MRRIVSIAVVLFAVGIVLGNGGRRVLEEPPAAAADPSASRPSDEAPQPERRRINWKADNAGPVTPGDSTIFLVGNFAAQHNGALISCDSAVQYSERHWEFFGHVLINKNTTYVYGDRASYDGDLNEARVYSELIKVVDGDATLYTYAFVYNTQTDVGEFSGGGILLNGENRLESQRGYYFGADKLVASVDEVQMRNEEYALKGDSVVYDLSNDNAFFFEHTNIWNRDGDYLYADRGLYRKADTAYFVTRNGYLLTKKQEIWSDSIDYFRPQGHVVLRHALQIDDTEHKSLAFGDYGEYWKSPDRAFLTRRPSVVSYDTEQGDTIFMRSDSMYLFTINRFEEVRRREREAAIADSVARMQADSTARVQPAEADGPVGDAAVGGRPMSESGTAAALEAAANRRADLKEKPAGDTIPEADAPDTMRVIDPLDTLTGEARKAYLKERKRQETAARKAAAAAAKKVKLDTVAARRKAKNAAKLDAQKAREEKRAEARRKKASSRLDARRARAARKGRPFGKVDSEVLARLDSLSERVAAELDSLSGWVLDSTLQVQRAGLLPPDTVAQVQPDSIYRLVKGFHRVKIYRTDFQVVCDSITGISTDSTLHLYIEPVLWNENNQVTSDSMTVYTEQQQITQAKFFGDPIMSSEHDTVYYNQIKGKTMTAFFRDNQIYRNDVVGNAQTIYYMTDGEPPVVTTMGVIESGDLSFYFEEKQLVQMTWRANPDYKFYPVFPDFQVPEDQSLYLTGFHWEGARRPTKNEVFDRVIRPTERAKRLQLAQPDFPIMQRIEAYKRRLIESRQWMDRNDPVDDQTVEWMHDLGYEVGQPRAESRPVEGARKQPDSLSVTRPVEGVQPRTDALTRENGPQQPDDSLQSDLLRKEPPQPVLSQSVPDAGPQLSVAPDSVSRAERTVEETPAENASVETD